MKKLSNPYARLSTATTTNHEKEKHPQKTPPGEKPRSLPMLGGGCVFETPSLCL